MMSQSLAPVAASVPENTVYLSTLTMAAVTQPTMIEFTRNAM